MILLDQSQPTVLLSSSSSSDSSFEDTLTDSSSETLQEIIRQRPKLKTKNPVVKEFVSDGNSVLDHLVTHISGDAFTTSTLNSPNHPINRFLSDPIHDNVDPEPEIPQNIPPPPKSPEYVFRASLLNKKFITPSPSPNLPNTFPYKQPCMKSPQNPKFTT
jgi:hypothetical protein